MDADVVVVGAGALGLSVALHLALLGRTVVVLDRGAAGSQASGRAAGLFKSIQTDELRTTLARRSIHRASTFSEWAGVPLAVERSGSLAIARTPAHRALLESEVAASRGWGVHIQDLTPTELDRRSSLYRPRGDEASWWCPEDVYIEEPQSLVDAYVAALGRLGAQVREHTEVVGIQLDGSPGRVTAIHTPDATLRTSVVVDAAGAWSRAVGSLAGAWIPVAPVRHQLAITEPTSSVDRGDPIVRVVDAAVYLRPARGGVMVGGFEADPAAVPAGEPVPADVTLDASVLERMVGAVEAQVPAAAGSWTEHRGGMFTMTPDGRFVVGPVPGVAGLWVASGCNGSGFSSSLGIGEALAAEIAEAPLVDLSPLAPSRIPATGDDALVAAGVWQYAHYYDPVPTQG